MQILTVAFLYVPKKMPMITANPIWSAQEKEDAGAIFTPVSLYETINALAGRRRLAFASKTPGRTPLINFFALGDAAFLVDLPGYGYAGVPLPVRQHWEALVGHYVAERECLAGVVIVMDARHPLTPLDHELLQWLAPAGRRVHVLLTKADKLSKQEQHKTLARTRAELARLYDGSSVQLFSSLKREGLSEAAAKLSSWVNDSRKTKAPAKGE